MSLKITEYKVLADVVLCGGDILHNPPEVVKIKLQKTNNLIKS